MPDKVFFPLSNICQLFPVRWAPLLVKPDSIAQWVHLCSMDLNNLSTIIGNSKCKTIALWVRHIDVVNIYMDFDVIGPEKYGLISTKMSITSVGFPFMYKVAVQVGPHETYL